MTIFGIDVHPQFQAGLDIERVREEGFDFLAVKCSEGTSTYGGQDWVRRGIACGLLSMMYHYLRPGNEQAQARVFADQLAQTGVPGMLDAEALAGDGHTATLNVSGIHRFLDCAAACGAKVPLLYLPRWYWQRMGSPDLSGLPMLWASGYVSASGYAAALYESVTPSAWSAYGGLPVAVLQFTDRAMVAGQHVDADAFHGSRDQFAGLLNSPLPRSQPAPVPPPISGSIPAMAYGENNSTVAALQRWLNAMFPAYSQIPVTGYYGDVTAHVVAEFQRRVGIVGGDGRNVGPRTATKLAEMGFRP